MLLPGLLDVSLLVPSGEEAVEFWEEVRNRTEAAPFNIPTDMPDEVHENKTAVSCVTRCCSFDSQVVVLKNLLFFCILGVRGCKPAQPF